MFRFTIRDVLWLTVVGAMGVQLTSVNAELRQRDAEARLVKSLALELDRKAIIGADRI